MVKLEIELDLNKLSDEELESYLNLKKKAKIQKAEQELEEIPSAPLERVQTIVDKTGTIKKRKSNRQIFSDEMISELYRLKDIRKMSMRDITDNLNRTFPDKVTEDQVAKKIGNLKYNKRWGTHLLLDTTRLRGASHRQIVDDSLLPQDKKPVTTRRPRGKQPRRDWDSIYPKINKLVNDEGYSVSKGFVQVIGRTPSGPETKAYVKWCKKKNLNPKGKKSWKPDMRKVKGHLVSKNPYLQWKNSNIGKLKDMSFEQANRFMAQIWRRAGKNKKKATQALKLELGLTPPEGDDTKQIVDEFPELAGLKKEFKPILVDMLNNMIEDHSLSMSYKMEGVLLGIESKSDWNKFIVSFTHNAKQIADYLGISLHRIKVRLLGHMETIHIE